MEVAAQAEGISALYQNLNCAFVPQDSEFEELKNFIRVQ